MTTAELIAQSKAEKTRGGPGGSFDDPASAGITPPPIDLPETTGPVMGAATGLAQGATLGLLEKLFPEEVAKARTESPKAFMGGEVASYAIPTTGPAKVLKGGMQAGKIVRGATKTPQIVEKVLGGAAGAGAVEQLKSLISGDTPETGTSAIIGGAIPALSGGMGAAAKAGGRKLSGKLLESAVKPAMKAKEKGLDLGKVGERGQLGLTLKGTMDKLNSRFSELGSSRKKALQDVKHKKINIDAIAEKIRARFDNPNDPLGNFDEKASEAALKKVLTTLNKFKIKDGLTDPVTAQNMAIQLFKKSIDIIKLGNVDEKAALKKVVIGTFDRELRAALDKTGARGVKAINKEFGELLSAAEQIQRRLVRGNTETIQQAITSGLLTGGAGAGSFATSGNPLEALRNAILVGAGTSALRSAKVPAAKTLSGISKIPEALSPTLKQAATRGAIGTGLTLQER